MLIPYQLLSLIQCMSPNYLYLHCTTGLCGLILYGDSDLCPVPCSAITHCDSCLRQVNCGWCSVGFNATKGVCLPGNISSPVNAVCRNNDVSGSTDIPGKIVVVEQMYVSDSVSAGTDVSDSVSGSTHVPGKILEVEQICIR